MIGITSLLGLLQAALVKRGDDEEPRDGADEARELEGTADPADSDVEPFPVPDPPEMTLAVRKVGAWTGWSSMATPKVVAQTIKAATFLGLKRLDIIVNDFAAAREPTPFTTYDKDKIVALAKAATAAKIDVHLLTWAMPHIPFIEGAARDLRDLVSRTGARSIVWDAEESWTKARKALPYAEAAKRIGVAFQGITMGITGIGYTPAERFGPLAEVCDYMVPQCYATSTSGLKPETIVPQLVRRYRQLFGKNKPVVCGLAAYRQPPKGYTIESSMRAAFAGAVADSGIHECVYWSLGAIRQSAAVTKVVKQLTTGDLTK